MVVLKVFAPTTTIVVNPLTSTGVLRAGYTISTDNARTGIDCTYPNPSPASVGPGTIWCGSTADNTFACWSDPQRAASILCTYAPWTGQLERVGTAGPVPARLPTAAHSEPAFIELVDGSRWMYRIGGAWSPTYPGTRPSYGCVGQCAAYSNPDRVLVEADTENAQTLQKNGKVWTVQVSQADYGSLPPPVTMPVAKVWYLSG